MTDLSILAVFDQSAILSFGRSPDVGEVMTMVEEDGGVVGLPVACMAEAVAAGADPDALELLARHAVTVLVEDGHHGWRAWGSIRTLVPDLGAIPSEEPRQQVADACDHQQHDGKPRADQSRLGEPCLPGRRPLVLRADDGDQRGVPLVLVLVVAAPQ